MKVSTVSLSLILVISACSQPASNEHGHSHDGEGGHSHTHAAATAPVDTLEAVVVPATDFAPEYIQHATNIEIIEDIVRAKETNGVLTHEGIFGPLLFAENIRAFFIELKAGMFLAEHPHPTESIVYTVSGKWVLCSEEKRQVMEAGSIFHFGSNMPTGWEAPFEGGAFLLVVKSKEEGQTFEPYTKGLQQMAQSLEEQMANGTEFYFNQLESDHPAMLFARSVNPDFDSVLAALEE